jgi:SAM-dependent methyltransferase
VTAPSLAAQPGKRHDGAREAKPILARVSDPEEVSIQRQPVDDVGPVRADGADGVASLARRALRRLPEPARRAVRRRLRRVRFGSLRRLTPVSAVYGFDRGLPIDRYYIEAFLARFPSQPGYAAGSIRGRLLEVGGREYADRFGQGVEHVDVLHAGPGNPEATIVGSLTDDRCLPADAFDCIICTQTLHVIFDTRAAVRTLHRALKPGGTLLVTVPGITRSCLPDRDAWGDWWRFTSLSLRRLLDEVFDADRVHVEAYGNVLAATSFLYGLAADELRRAELDARDRDFEVIVAGRAIKS